MFTPILVAMTGVSGNGTSLFTNGIPFSEKLTAQSPIPEAEFSRWRQQMVEQQIQRRGIRDQQVLEALRTVPRHRFVPDDLAAFAYVDHPLAIGHEQTISQPYIVAFMTELAQISPADRVLEIGTGSGYQAAILAELANTVFSVERIPELADQARKILAELGYRNVYVKTGDGYQGWAEHAPYDVILGTAAPTRVPPALIDQLAVNGRLVLPVGLFWQDIQIITKTETGITVESVMPVRFVAMVPGTVAAS
jgi:protein-L-isoaspartate(D-aspartate) O-methyltransferase